jgi:DNA-binding beta-propeller fold protein YncE
MAFVANWYHTRTAAEFGFVGNQSNGGCLATNTNSSYCTTQSLTLNGGKIDSIAVNPNTGLIYVANVKGDMVNVISESTGTDVANITVPSPVGIAVDQFSNLVYVASNDTSTNSLIVISGSTNAIVDSVPVGNGPANVAVDTNTNTIYVSSADDGTISAIDGTSLLS